ncbi:MAG: thermonuclease family protein [Chloroflexota bacterium]
MHFKSTSIPIYGLIILTLLACSLSNTPITGEFPLAPDAPQLPNQPSETARVVEVIDGDTIRVRLDGEVVSVRYIGINTPERDETCFQEATNNNANYVENQTVRLVTDVNDTDRFGRLLRYVYVDEILVNAELVAGGWAESRAFEPDTRLFDYLEGLEETAVRERRGCQATSVFE